MKVLIADDDRLSLLYLQDTLEDWGYDVETVADGQSACDRLQQPDAPMLAIIDWMMPGLDGIDVCRLIRGRVRDRYVYLIMLTSRSETELVVEAMNAGADDFIGKPFNVEELQVRIRAGRRISELEQKLRLKASHDALTGIYNRGAVIDILEKELVRLGREHQPVAVIFADLDHFKRTNDVYGHLAGDAVLREVTRRVGAVLRPYDSLGRYGGEELLIVLPACDAAGAMEVAERVRSAVAAHPVATEFGAIPSSLSIGVAAVGDGRSLSCSGLMQLADAALYRAKEGGRNRIELAKE
ncbi:MAG: diguanylate cyclase response regulator [Massilia sp.]|nr:diguanylate cyclase response regulator [Massilia sp.]MDB5792878.1 diguanylate cyclase response regulator [Massilia sp.]